MSEPPEPAVTQTEAPPPDGAEATAPYAVEIQAPGRPQADVCQIGDFLLIRLLGGGAFGNVFLARQVSLDRLVALKVTATESRTRAEGMALAGLEHDHIVKVYSGFTDPESGRHCLCLQYVPGTDLSAVVKELHRPGAPAPQSGRHVLAAVDRLAQGESLFDPAAAQEREALAGEDFPQAVCKLGEKLALALAFAHANGVLHCDIKPANVLLTPYGRPMLADFNVAFDRARRQPNTSVGGTLAYMAPEHLRAMADPTGPDQVDERCDVYSLGVALCELATGARPKRPTIRGLGLPTPRSEPPDEPAPPEATQADSSGEILAGVPRELAAVIRRCLARDPADRYQTAGELAEALAGARALLTARRNLPPAGRVGHAMLARPFRALIVLALMPQVIASVLNIAYNAAEIVSYLSPAQQASFDWLVIAYNVAAYPAAVVVGFVLLRDLHRRWVALPRADGSAVDTFRRRALTLGWWAVGLSAVGWFPGGLIFPLGIHLFAGPLPWQAFAHFLVSFALAGLVGMVFSYMGVMAVVLRTFYPASGNPDRFSPDLARAEVSTAVRLLGPFRMLAAVVPLTGAVLLVLLADERLTLAVRFLVVGMIGLGMAGVSLADRLTDHLRRLAAVWTDDSRATRRIDPEIS